MLPDELQVLSSYAGVLSCGGPQVPRRLRNSLRPTKLTGPRAQMQLEVWKSAGALISETESTDSLWSTSKASLHIVSGYLGSCYGGHLEIRECGMLYCSDPEKYSNYPCQPYEIS